MVADGERVVFYSASFFKIDGVTLTIRGLIRHITEERGGRVLVLTADDPADSTVAAFTESSGGRAEVLRVAGGLVPAPGADYFMGLYLTRPTKEALESYCPTVVHITNPDLVALWLVNWVLRERKDCVVMATLHTDFMEIVNCYCGVGRKQALWTTSSFLRHVYGLCPAVYAPTEFMRRKVEGEGWDTQLGVWGRGVDPDLFSPSRRCQDLRRHLGLGPNDVAALWLGRVVHEKQPGVWLQAVHKVQREAQERYDTAVAAGEDEEALPPRVVGVCVGQGEAMGMLEGADGVVCVGWKAGEELARVVASCDVMVAPSEIETFGRVTLEAMSCGVACVVNRECGDHLVTDGVNGFCVGVGDKEGYVTGLRKLVQDRDERSKMGAMGREMATGYGTAEVYDGMLEVYRSCRKTQDKDFRARKTKKAGWPFWEAFGLLIYYIFEVAKMLTAVLAFATHGGDSEVVRLSVKAFRSHLSLLGRLVGLKSLPPSPSNQQPKQPSASKTRPSSSSSSSSSSFSSSSSSSSSIRSSSSSSSSSLPLSSSSSSSSSPFSRSFSAPPSFSTSGANLGAGGNVNVGGGVTMLVTTPPSTPMISNNWPLDDAQRLAEVGALVIIAATAATVALAVAFGEALAVKLI